MISTVVGVAIVILVAYVLYGFSDVIVQKVVRSTVRHENYSSKESERKREDTLIQFFTRILRAVILILGIFAFFSQLGVELAPLLAAAGVFGIAIGFGTQYLVRDLFTGAVLVSENQYRVGDSVCINNVCGDVEQISLRFTRLRDMDGVVYFIPHGEIKIVSNKTRGFSRMNLNITVSHETNLDYAIAEVNKTGEEFLADAQWKEALATPPKVLRVEELADAGVVLKIVADTLPGRNIEVTGEFRRRIKLAFEKKGIISPFSKAKAVKKPKVTPPEILS